MNRRPTREVRVGRIGLGGKNPVRIQSMTTAAPEDVEGTVEECLRLAAAGCELTRISTPKTLDAARLEQVRTRLRERSIGTPLVADIHYLPAAALRAAETADKVRINPGNFADARFGREVVYSEEMYAAELRRIEKKARPLFEELKKRRKPLRIGANHGSLSKRILCRYGDTPKGMVESAMEYLRIGEKLGYFDFVLSMKASNPRVMAQAYRLLRLEMEKEGMEYPLHVGVTEAGEGEDGRIRSAVGIGAVLAEGLGDTIRVSLAEPPENEIPVCREIIRVFEEAKGNGAGPIRLLEPRRKASAVENLGGSSPVRILGEYGKEEIGECEIPVEGSIRAGGTWRDISDEEPLPRELPPAEVYRARISDAGAALSFVREVVRRIGPAPLILSYDVDRRPEGVSPEVAAAIALGVPLIEGFGDGIEVRSSGNAGRIPLSPSERHSLAIGVLQNSLTRISRVEIIACPSCGRTLFDLPEVTQIIKKRFSHLKGVRIAVMGCIVNGPGEMADADFGFVGGAPGKINLYRGRECVEKGVPIAEAYERMRDLIAASGRWVDP
ncbi:MAG: 4-hydroxy-3-methylbut-2-en-1-yl diphosphate synthase [Candidatus Hydrogenedentota bacterium]|nr:MAG: 4-hydroxy-3-methylbut-2-en-1-yl diphosphate synthase [Candidatus Hydrogenedentota bacterium]